MTRHDNYWKTGELFEALMRRIEAVSSGGDRKVVARYKPAIEDETYWTVEYKSFTRRWYPVDYADYSTEREAKARAAEVSKNDNLHTRVVRVTQ